jgi:alpha/beta superfamily hydrolase
MARLLESTTIEGPAGPLEALHEGPDDGTAIVRAAVVCHPHPLFGGTMHNKVVFRLARAARRSGAAVLRFNFRGVGLSAGEHAGGIGEQDDLRAALEYMSSRYPDLPFALAGFSFGSRVAARVFCGNLRIERLICAGTPVAKGEWSFLERCSGPKFFLHSTNDEHGPKAAMHAVFDRAGEPKQITWIESGDHFFSDALDRLEEAAYEAMTADVG